MQDKEPLLPLFQLNEDDFDDMFMKPKPWKTKTATSNKDEITQFDSLSGIKDLNHPSKRFKHFFCLTIRFLYKHNIFASIWKLGIGLLFIGLPVIMTLLYAYFSKCILLHYFPLAYIVSLGIYTAILIFVLFVKIFELIRAKIILLNSWERKNLGRLMYSIFISAFIIWCFLTIEKFVIDYPIINEKVKQQTIKTQTSGELDTGMYLINVLFILIFWDIERFDQLGFISFQTNFIEYLCFDINWVANAVWTLSILYGVKIIFIQTKYSWLYFMICLCLIFEAALFKCFYHNLKDPLYKYSNTHLFQAIEMIPIFLILLCLLCWVTMKYAIGLYSRKFTSCIAHKMTVIIVVFASWSLIAAVIGIVILLIAGGYLMISMDINHTLQLSKLVLFKKMLKWGFAWFSFGNCFLFGDYFWKIIFKPILVELFPAVLKNMNYIKVSKNHKRMKSFKRKLKKIKSIK